MAMSETAVLYSRILGLLPTDALQKGSNAVVATELARLSLSVDDVEAAFAKLQEIRDAVTELHRQMPMERSASLSNALTSATLLHEELMQSVMALLPASKDSTHLRKKRKRDNGKHAEKMHSKRSTDTASAHFESEASKDVTHKSESESTDESELEGSEAAWKQVTKAKIRQSVPHVENAGMNPTHSESLRIDRDGDHTVEPDRLDDFNSEMMEVDALPLQERIPLIPGVLRSFAAEMASGKWDDYQTPVFSRFKVLIEWAGQSAHRGHPLDIYWDYFKQVQAYADKLPESPQKHSLNRRNQGFSTFLSNLSGESEALRAIGESTRNELIEHSTFDYLAKKAAKLPTSRRQQLMPTIVQAFQAEAAEELDPQRTTIVLRALKSLLMAVVHDRRDPKFLQLYRQICASASLFACRISNSSKREKLRRVVSVVTEWLDLLPVDESNHQIMLKRVKKSLFQLSAVL